MLRPVALGEHAADGIRESEVQRAAVFERERERRADEARRILDSSRSIEPSIRWSPGTGNPELAGPGSG